MKDFRAFILRGNAIDLAVGVVMGAAFGALVNSMVGDLITPLFGIFGSPDFSELTLKAGRATVYYGRFLNAIISLLITGFGVFFLVLRPVNRLMDRKKTEPDVESPTIECPHCLSSIPRKATRCAFCTSEVSPA